MGADSLDQRTVLHDRQRGAVLTRSNIMLVVGARPQFIKSAPVIEQILGRHKRIDLRIVHSGQHYDPEMSAIFFQELQIPKPSLNLHAGSGSHATQTAAIMKGLERSMSADRPDLVVVSGDTNTTLAAALTAAKLQIPVAHIEAGLRSGDFTMPEEINRVLTDHCSMLLFAPTKTAVRNLKAEGLSGATRLTGDTMLDTLTTVMPRVEEVEESVLARFGAQAFDYVLVTLHRPSNVDDLRRLREIQHALRKIAVRLRVIFLVHPRTRKRLAKLGLPATRGKSALTFANPQGYIETLALLKNARCLLTDSGGMQKESFLLHVPCATLRTTTEWPETLVGKANRLITNPKNIPSEVLRAALDDNLKNRIRKLKNPYGDGHASARIAGLIEDAATSLKLTSTTQ